MGHVISEYTRDVVIGTPDLTPNVSNANPAFDGPSLFMDRSRVRTWQALGDMGEQLSWMSRSGVTPNTSLRF